MENYTETFDFPLCQVSKVIYEHLIGDLTVLVKIVLGVNCLKLVFISDKPIFKIIIRRLFILKTGKNFVSFIE
jgi:hypothetical protein